MYRLDMSVMTVTGNLGGHRLNRILASPELSLRTFLIGELNRSARPQSRCGYEDQLSLVGGAASQHSPKMVTERCDSDMSFVLNSSPRVCTVQWYETQCCCSKGDGGFEWLIR